MSADSLRDPEYAYNTRFLGRGDQAGAPVPPPPTRIVDPRPNRPAVLRTADAFIGKDGVVYGADLSSGLYIMEYSG